LAITELDEGIATPIPRPESASAIATTHALELGCSDAKRPMGAVKNAAPATALTRWPLRAAT
jgi:hypothetical protein